MEIAVFLLSVGVALIVLMRARIQLISPYGIFLGFQVLYNVTPWIAGAAFGLDPDALNTQLILAATANLAFAIAVAIFYRSVDLAPIQQTATKARWHYLGACVPIFFLAVVLCHYYGWHVFAEAGTVEGVGVMPRLAEYSKQACIAAWLYYLIRFGLDRFAWVLFYGLMIIMIIDGARTNFLPVIIIILMLWQSSKHISGWKIAAMFVLGALGLTAVRGLLIGASGLDVVLGGVALEGTFGSLTAVQSIYAVQHMSSPPYLFGLGSLQSWVKGINPWIEGEFAPIGGYYYLAGAVADFGYVGPALETFLFGYLLCASEKWKGKRPMIYFSFVATIGTLFAKIPVENSIKLFLAQMFFLAVITTLRKLNRLAALSSHRVVKPHLADQSSIANGMQTS